MPDDSSRERDYELLRGLLHELRQPLTAASGALTLLEQLLPRDVRDGRDWQLLNEQLSRLIGTLQAFDELASATQTDIQEFNVLDVVDAAVLHGVRLHNLRPGVLTHEGPRAGRLVRGSPRALNLALNNLVSNAWEACRERAEPRIAIHLVEAAPHLEVRVSDNGTGIAASIAEQLFQPGRSTKRDSGHGLGLFISRQLIQRAGGGFLVVHDGEDKRLPWARTEFAIRLPAVSLGRSPSTAPVSRQRIEKPVALVADDEPAIVYLVDRILRTIDVTSVTVSDGDQAITKLGTQKFDVIILDKNMPGADGVQVAQAARATDPHVPIIMLTGYPSADALEDLLPLNMHGFLEKPFSHESLTKLVQRALAAPVPSRPNVSETTGRIAIVDRDAAVCRQVAQHLTAMQLTHATFTTVAEALDQCPDAAAILVAEQQLADDGARERLWAKGFSRTGAMAIGLLVDQEGLGANVRAVLAGARGTLPRRLLANPEAARQRLRQILDPKTPVLTGSGKQP